MSKKKKPFYNWFASDFLGSSFVQGLSLTEECCYRRLLDFQATSPERRISTDAKTLRRQCKNMSRTQWIEVWSALAEKFEPHPDGAGGLINTVLYGIMLSADTFKQERSDSGTLGNEIKKRKQDAQRTAERDAQLDTERTETGPLHVRKTHASISTSQREGEMEHRNDSLTHNSATGVAGVITPFQTFWGLYPKRRGKGNAEKVWKRDRLDPMVDTICAAIAVQKRWPDWLKNRGEFIPHPASWLNAQGWDDEPTAALFKQPDPTGAPEAHPPHWCSFCPVPHEHPCDDMGIPGLVGACTWPHETACRKYAEL